MLLNGATDPALPIAIPQTSHAFMAWQLADHWGNRVFARPAPRAEVLAAVLLHDSGWTEFDVEPGIDSSGRLRTFDAMAAADHLQIWRSSVARASQHSRYAALLVAHRFSVLAERKTSSLLARGDTSAARAVQSVRAELERQCDLWREQLARDARYERSLDGEGFEANASLLAACDAIAVSLCCGRDTTFSVNTITASGVAETITISPLGDDRWRVRPWPLMGDRVRLLCEGRRLQQARFATADEAAQALAQAPTIRLGFVLLRPSARG